MTSLEHVAPSPADRSRILVGLDSTVPIHWNGPVRGPSEVGAWRRAFAALAVRRHRGPAAFHGAHLRSDRWRHCQRSTSRRLAELFPRDHAR